MNAPGVAAPRRGPGPLPGEHPAQRVALFVDTQNLFYAARDAADRFLDYEHLLRDRRRAGATCTRRPRTWSSARGRRTPTGSSPGCRRSATGCGARKVRVHRADDQGRTVLEGDWDMGIAADIVRAWDHPT
jgi:uncharacterized LabA/DUF88 family protein